MSHKEVLWWNRPLKMLKDYPTFLCSFSENIQNQNFKTSRLEREIRPIFLMCHRMAWGSLELHQTCSVLCFIVEKDVNPGLVMILGLTVSGRSGSPTFPNGTACHDHCCLRSWEREIQYLTSLASRKCSSGVQGNGINTLGRDGIISEWQERSEWMPINVLSVSWKELVETILQDSSQKSWFTGEERCLENVKTKN